MNLTEIDVTRTIPASAEEIYDAWLDSSRPGGPWHGCAKLIIDVKVDGLFYHAVHWDNKTWAHYGRFIKLERGKCIEFSWMSAATKGNDSIVTLTLTPKGTETEVHLHHSGVPDDALGLQHKDGWTWMLSAIDEKYRKEKQPS